MPTDLKPSTIAETTVGSEDAFWSQLPWKVESGSFPIYIDLQFNRRFEPTRRNETTYVNRCFEMDILTSDGPSPF